MLHTAGIFAISAALLVMVSCRPHEESICSGKLDGIYRDPLNEKLFYICTNENPFLHMSCGREEVFDYNLKICVGDKESKDGEIEDLINDDNDSNGLLGEDIKSESLEILKNSPLWQEDAARGISKLRVYNIRLEENIFPKSLLFIGKANREQKNK